MFKQLTQNLQRQAPISQKDLEKIVSSLKVRHLKKKKNLLDEGDSAQQIFYLDKGLFRYYIHDSEGCEQTIELISEHNWFGDAKAFITQQTATINIEALEDSQVFALNYDDLNRFYDEIPMFERAVRKITEHYFIKALDHYKTANRTGHSAQSRYQDFLRAHPQMENRIPAIYLASYLGLAPETLSRLRHQSVKI